MYTATFYIPDTVVASDACGRCGAFALGRCKETGYQVTETSVACELFYPVAQG